MEKETKNLTLPLKEKWYRMIESGEKKEEYRGGRYWYKRLTIKPLDIRKPLGVRHFDTVTFTLGYPRKDDTTRRMTFKCEGIHIGKGKPEWGAEPGEYYYIIKIGERIK